MCNCGCEHKIMSEFGSITDFDVVYTGETITCGDDVIIDQGESLRSVLETLGNKACESDSNNDDIVEKVNDLEVSLQGTDDIAKSALSSANNANDKADDALNQIANLPDPIIEVNPNDVGLSKANMIPISSSGTQWQNGGIEVSQDPTSTSLVQRIDGRIKVSPASEEDDAVTKKQLDDAQFEAGIRPDNIDSEIGINAPRSLILLSTRSNIEGMALIGRPNSQNLLLGSTDSSIKGHIYNNAIIASSGAIMDRGPGTHSHLVRNNAIMASADCSLQGARGNCIILASHNSHMEPYNVSGQYKWNSTIISARNCLLQSSNSYTILSGQGNISNGSGQIVSGAFNIQEASRSMNDPLKKNFILGNGEAGYYDVDNNPQDISRSNAFYVTHGGKAWVQNEFEVDRPGGGVVLKSPNGTRFLLTVGDDGSLGTTEI